MIFVFGSNEAGIHGGGAARTAFHKHDAQWGVGIGRFGNSYALPTKDRQIQTLPLEAVRKYVDEFLAFAEATPDETFQVTRIGCGLAGFKDEQIAPLFLDAPKNCLFDEAWKPLLPSDKQFWGTFYLPYGTNPKP